MRSAALANLDPFALVWEETLVNRDGQEESVAEDASVALRVAGEAVGELPSPPAVRHAKKGTTRAQNRPGLAGQGPTSSRLARSSSKRPILRCSLSVSSSSWARW